MTTNCNPTPTKGLVAESTLSYDIRFQSTEHENRNLEYIAEERDAHGKLETLKKDRPRELGVDRAQGASE